VYADLWYSAAVMRPIARLTRLLLVSAMFVAMLAGAAFGQETSPGGEDRKPGDPAPTPPPGICAPWHQCVAYGLVGSGVLYLLFLGGQYWYQSRGFDTLEHKQGNPDGVPVRKP